MSDIPFNSRTRRKPWKEPVRHYTVAGSQTRSKQHQVFGGDPFPRTVREAKGVYVWSDDGQRYMDWIAGLGAIGLGYQCPAVEGATQAQMRKGVTFPLPTLLEEQVSEDLCRLFKWPEQVRWVKTGSEATAGAMMIARRATGRRKIVSMGYHGWHECHQSGPDLVDAPMGEWGALHDMIDDHTAAVLVEAIRNVRRSMLGLRRDLQEVIQQCRKIGALFILDEMVTGFRWATGGISEYCQIQPDLACYGKALGNGYPIAVIVGPRRLMCHAVDVSSTFGGECVGLAAAQSTMRVYQQERVTDRMWRLGERLLGQCPALTGWPVHPVFKDSADYTTSEQVIPLVQAVARRGHLTHPSGFNVMAAHTEADVDSLAEAINAGV